MKRVLVASVPRSGSTMVFRAVAGLEPGSVSPRDYAGPHLKTHSFNPSEFIGKVDVAIFLFGDIVASVASTQARRNTAEHFANCGAGHLDPRSIDLFERDYLNYERIFDAWMAPVGFPHVCVRYEKLHDLAPTISLLTGVPLPLPAWRARRGGRDLAREDRARIRKAYSALRRKIAKAPDLQWWGPDMGR